MNRETRIKISNTLKAKGIKPPSNKGRRFSEEHVYKIIESKRRNGSLYHTKDRTEKIQASRKKHYDLVGRISSVRDLIERTNEYRQWRKSVFERDNYTCVKCIRHGGYLEANHKIPLAYYLKLGNYNTEEIMKLSDLFNIENGETLCKPCHMETSTYGSGANKFISMGITYG